MKERKQTEEEQYKREIYKISLLTYSMGKRRFPTLAVILLVFAAAWLMSDLGYLAIDIPWIPVMLVVVAIGWIINRYTN